VPSAQAPAAPLADPARLAALHATGLLTRMGAPGRAPAAPPPGQEGDGFARVARLAARALGAPVAQVNVVTVAAQVPVATHAEPPHAAAAWQAPVGLDASYCGHVVASGAPLLVEDARADPRVREGRATAGAKIVAYAGVPLRMPAEGRRPGAVLGSVCVFDFAPRRWTPDDVAALDDLAAVAGAEVALAMREARYGALAHAVGELVWTTAPDGRVDDAPAWRAYTGQSADEVRGWGWLDAVHPDDRARTAGLWQAAVDARAAYETEYRVRGADGVYRWRRARGVPVLGGCGSGGDGEAAPILEWVGCCVDVDGRKRAEAERAAAQAALEAANARLRDQAVDSERSHRQLQVQAAELELVTRRLEEQQAELGARAEELQATAAHLEEQVEAVERSRAELAVSEARFRAVFERAAVGMGRVGFADARWMDVNDAFCRMLGRSRAEMLATPWPEITHPDDVDLDLVPFRRMAAGELESYAVEKRFVHKAGHPVWARLTLSLVRDAAGRPDYEIAVIEDITARHAAAAALRTSEAFARSVVAASPDCVKTLALDGRLLTMNAAGCALMEVDDFRLIAGADWPAFWAAGGAEADARAAVATARAGETARFQGFCPTAKGAGRWWDVLVAPIRDAGGAVVRLLSVSRDVTEQQQVAAERERLLVDSEAARAAVDLERRRLAAVLGQLPVGVWIAEAPSGRIVEVNGAVADFWGVSPTTARIADYSAEYVGYHPAGSAEAGRRVASHEWPLARAISTGEVVTDEVLEIERPDGTRRVASFSAAPIRGADGRVVGGVVASLDVTERARLLKRVSEERAQLARLVDALPVLVTVYDPALAATPAGATQFNRAFVDTLGWTEADARAGDLMALCYPDPAVRATAAAHMAAPAGGPDASRDGPLWRELPTRAKDGRVVPVLWTNVRLAGDRQVGVGVDLTDRKSAEAALEAERTLLQAVLAQMPVGVSVAEAPSGRILFTNPAGVRLLGETLDTREAGEYDRYGALHDDATPYAAAEYPLIRALAGETVDQQVMRYRRGDGRVTHLAVSAAPVVDAAGRTVRAVATWTDVAERVALEGALRRARDAAEVANAAKSQFLANMSHELRTPLNAIGGYTQLLEMGLHGPVTPAQAEALGRVQGAQRRLLALINDILNYAKLESGTVEYDVRAVDARDLVAEVVPLIAPQAAAKGLALDVRMPDAPCLVWADGDKLGQVLVNLLSNATKFTDARNARTGEPGRITVDLRTRRGTSGRPAAGEAVGEPGPGGRARGGPGARVPLDAAVFLRVQDTGVGIPRARQAAIFDPFVQVRTGYALATEGTGLGLAISRDLARGMGGDLRVRSAEGEGSTFTVALRRAVDVDGRQTERRTHDERRHDERRRGEDRRGSAPGDGAESGDVSGP
jgi:PAS domain S-box-containing protein